MSRETFAILIVAALFGLFVPLLAASLIRSRRDGPAPRGMDRFPVGVQNGLVHVDTTQVVTGPPRGTDTIRQDPEGPFCVNIGGG